MAFRNPVAVTVTPNFEGVMQAIAHVWAEPDLAAVARFEMTVRINPA
jgi:hypothetical protein